MAKKKNTAIEGLLWLLMLAPGLYLLSIWQSLPAEIATHFDINGNPNAWSDKTTVPYLILGMNVGVYILLKIIPKIDPKKNLDFVSHYQKIRVIMQVFIATLSIALLLGAQDPSINAANLISFPLILLVVLLGNYFQSIKANYFIGIRTPWTLESENVWKKTHRLGGKIWFFGGLLMLLLLFVLPSSISIKLIVAFMLLSTIFLFIYSYVLFKKEKNNKV